MFNPKTIVALAVLAALATAPARAQASLSESEALIESIQDGNAFTRTVFTMAAEQMSEEDYDFRPTPEVRSFGELLAHVAGSNYFFCSTAIGETAPVREVEEVATTRAAIGEALAQSFDYCEATFETARLNADASVEFDGEPRSPMAVLNFRIYHALLHYGNVVTYMRLRGKVPPSSQLPESQ